MSLSASLRDGILFGLKQKFPDLKSLSFQVIGGGSINHNYKITSGPLSFFCKINSATKFPQLFRKEMHALQVLSRYRIWTPEVYFTLEEDGYQVMAMEWMEEGEKMPSFWEELGEDLARLHSVTRPSFGFDEDNYMGSVPQLNRWTKDWCSFFQNQRLEPLVAQCADQQLLSASEGSLFQNLYKKLPEIFDNADRPSLQHGDFWAGNFLCNKTENPVFIDPAVYFGHPAVDIGMTQLFGGFATDFYKAYEHHSPMPSKEQCTVANLYPLLIHLLLFGSSYKSNILQILKRFQ